MPCGYQAYFRVSTQEQIDMNEREGCVHTCSGAKIMMEYPDTYRIVEYSCEMTLGHVREAHYSLLSSIISAR